MSTAPPAAPNGKTSSSNKKRARTRAEDALSRFHEEGALEQGYDGKNLLRLWPFVKPHRGFLFLSLGLLLVNSAFAMAKPRPRESTPEPLNCRYFWP